MSCLQAWLTNGSLRRGIAPRCDERHIRMSSLYNRRHALNVVDQSRYTPSIFSIHYRVPDRTARKDVSAGSYRLQTHTHTHTHTHRHIHTYTHTYLHTYIHTYIHIIHNTTLYARNNRQSCADHINKYTYASAQQRHVYLSLAAQCIVIGPVCNGRAGVVCLWLCGSVTTITRNCAHRSSPNWVCR